MAVPLEAIVWQKKSDSEQTRCSPMQPTASLRAGGRSSARAIQAAKYVFDQIHRGSEADPEGCAARVRACFESTDFIEGRRAFMEKRKPVFAGR